MNLIDANAVNDVLRDGIRLDDEYFLAPDVVDEVELTSIIHGKTIPIQISNLDKSHLFDLGIYLKHYKVMLNKHSGRSFFNMTGLGDISILAAIHATLDSFEVQKREQLFDPTEPIKVFTRDNRLKKRICSEFAGMDVEVQNCDKLV